MVLLHGFTGSSESWGGAIVDGLASAGHPPTLLDLPGHGRNAGRTDPLDFTLDAACLTVATAMGERAGPLVGYSMGGRIALAYACRHPERVTHLVLESASPGLASEEDRAARRAADEELAVRLESWGIDAFVDHWESLPIFGSQRALSPEVREAQRARRLANDPHSLAAALRALGTGALPSFWEALPGLRVPTLLLVGALDVKFVEIAERMAELLPNARLTAVPGAGHAVHLERPDAWLPAVVDFATSA